MIPKIFHRLHLSSEVLKNQVKLWDEQILRLNPGWEIKYWTAKDLPQFQNQALYDLCENTGHRADIARYEILHKYGGVYIDWDMKPLKPLPDLTDVPAFCGYTKPINYDDVVFEHEIAILGSIPNHPFFSFILQEITPWAITHYKRDVCTRTGPAFFSQMMEDWGDRYPGVKCFPQQVFYPYDPREKQMTHLTPRDSVFVHQWWGTWLFKNGHTREISPEKVRQFLRSALS